MNKKGVCRTSPATPGVLFILGCLTCSTNVFFFYLQHILDKWTKKHSLSLL